MKRFIALLAFLLLISVHSGLAQNQYGPLNQPSTWTAIQTFSAGITGYQIIPVGYQVTSWIGLAVTVGSGKSYCGGAIYNYAGGNLTMLANSTNYIYLDSSASCAPASSTISFGGNMPLAEVFTNSSGITSIVDERTIFMQSSGGSGGNCPGSAPNSSVLFNSSGACSGSTKFTTNSSAQVDINSGGTFEVDSVNDPSHNFVYSQGHQVYVDSNSRNWDGVTNDGYTVYVDDSATPPQASGALTGTNVTVSSGTLTVAATNASTLFTFPGEYAYFTGCTAATQLNGNVYQVTDADTTQLVAVNTGLGDYSSTADSCTIKYQQSSNPTPFYGQGAAQYGGNLTTFDSETGGENPYSNTLTDFLAGAYGDGPTFGYGFRAKPHDLVQVESAAFIADTDGADPAIHNYAFKAGLPNWTPFWWVDLTGNSFSRQGFTNIASSSVGSCSLSVGLSDCTPLITGSQDGPPSSEILNITICATGAVSDTFDWTLDGTSPTCSSQHLIPTISGQLVADGVQMMWGSQTGHTVGATASIPITVTYGSQITNTGGTYLKSTALSTPSSPILTAATGGVDTWSYCVSESWNGITTDCSAVANVSSVGTLNGTNNISIYLNNSGVGPQTFCYVYRTGSGGTPSTTGIIAGPVDCGSTVVDTGLAGDSSSTPSTNLTGHLTLSDGYILFPPGISWNIPQMTGSGPLCVSGGIISFTDHTCGGSGSSSWSSLTSPSADLTLSTSTHNSTFNASTTSTWAWANTTAATSLASADSPVLQLYGNYWNGSASEPDTWSIQNYVANGTNGKSTFVIGHSGTSGFSDVGVNGYLGVYSLGSATANPLCYNASLDQFSYNVLASCNGINLTGNIVASGQITSGATGFCIATSCITAWPSGGGGGVSSVAAPSASWPSWLVPTVTNPTSTPSLTVAVGSVAAHSVFGNFTGSSAAPGFTAAPTFSAANLTNFPSTLLTTTLASANFLVGNGSNLAAAVAASKDVSLANTGAFTVIGLNGTLLSGLGTGLMLNTTVTGVPSIYGGSSTCTGQDVIQTLSASGVASCLTAGNVTAVSSPAQYETGVWVSGTTMKGVGPGTTGYPLVSGGASAYPSFALLGTVGGGTGVSDPTAHYIPVAEGASAFTFLTPGTSGYVLSSQGTGSDPVFQALTAAQIPVSLTSTTSVNNTTIPASSTLTRTLGSGTISLGTLTLTPGTCETTITVAVSGVATSDNILLDLAQSPLSVTGYSPSGPLVTIYKWPTSGNINVASCNNSGNTSNIAPGTMNANWRVVR